LGAHEGEPPSSPTLRDDLAVVERQTRSTVKLARDPERNLIRNSGQYWKALGVLQDTVGDIALTPFGRSVADRNTTRVEFATTVVKTMRLPNSGMGSSQERWQRAGLEIRPLELILRIIVALRKTKGREEAYLTPDELAKLVIPLAGNKASLGKYVAAILLYREGRLKPDREGWPDCTPAANDERMAREFLLFLGNYGICNVQTNGSKMEERYSLGALSAREASKLVSLPQEDDPMDALEEVKESSIPFSAERVKVMREITARPQQPLFRRNVLIAYKNSCAVTGESMPTVLEAAHIRPVTERGSDLVSNGICLRADIHALFDAGHLQIGSSGQVKLSDSARKSVTYGSLPSQIQIPSFVSRENLEWRWMYY